MSIWCRAEIPTDTNEEQEGRKLDAEGGGPHPLRLCVGNILSERALLTAYSALLYTEKRCRGTKEERQTQTQTEKQGQNRAVAGEDHQSVIHQFVGMTWAHIPSLLGMTWHTYPLSFGHDVAPISPLLWA